MDEMPASLGGRARERLARDVVIWLTTVTPSGQPQSAPVWFLVDGDEIIVYSLAGAARLRNIRANPRVSLNLNSTPGGGEVVAIEGVARIDVTAPSSDRLTAFQAKYRPRLDEYGWTPAYFAAEYPVAIRIRPTRMHGG